LLIQESIKNKEKQSYGSFFFQRKKEGA
jgi:hypothetical protein